MDKEKKEKLLQMPLGDLIKFRNSRECARDLNYGLHGYVGQRIRELDLGVDLSELGIPCLNKSTRVLSPEDFEILKESLLNKRKAGRKPGPKPKEGERK